MAGKAFAPVRRSNHASLNPQPPWLNCEVKDSVFHGAGDADRLGEILELILAGPGRSRRFFCLAERARHRRRPHLFVEDMPLKRVDDRKLTFECERTL